MPSPAPILVDWPSAHAVILEHAARRRGDQPVLVVGVTGPVGSGKSTLAERLGGTVVSTDSYLPDYDRLPRESWDDPAHADLPLLATHLRELRAGRAASVPVWSFQSHSRVGYRDLRPERIVVCEGLHALHALVRPILDLAIFVDAPASVRWGRCEQRELQGERGWGVQSARTFFHEVAEPTFSRLSDGYKRVADVLVVNDGPR